MSWSAGDRAGSVEGDGFSPVEIRSGLERVLRAPEFSASGRISAFLRYIVGESLAGRSDRIKQYTVAVNAFQRKADFDPHCDSVVRVQAGRLREALRSYYRGPGQDDWLRIEIPKGTYVPRFRRGPATRKQEASARASLGRPVIAILPFSSSPKEEYFSEGIAEDLSTELTQFDDLKTIAYFSSQRFRNSSESLPAIARQLGAGFIISGSVVREKAHLRLRVRLLEGHSSCLLWSDRYRVERDVKPIFELQAEISRRIVARVAGGAGVLARHLTIASRDMPPDSISAYEAMLWFRHYTNVHTPEAFRKAQGALQHAVSSGSTAPGIWSMMAGIILDGYTLGYAKFEDPIRTAVEYAEKGVHLGPRCHHCRTELAYAYLLADRLEDAVREALTSLKLNRNNGLSVGVAGWVIALAGRFSEGLSLIEESRALNPFFPAYFHLAPWLKHLVDGNHEAALAEANLFHLPELFWTPLLRCVSLERLQRTSEAQAAFVDLLRLCPDFEAHPEHYVHCIVKLPDARELIFESLCASGLRLPEVQPG